MRIPDSLGTLPSEKAPRREIPSSTVAQSQKKVSKSTPAWLRALGRRDLPPEITIDGRHYRHARTYKHDFFAATAAYAGPAGQVVLKVQRQADFFGLPLAWIGRFLVRREARLLARSQTVPGVPRYCGKWGETGLVHEFVAGHPLRRHDSLDDEFFPRLSAMLDEIHGMEMAYVDLEKRENILLGDDGRPYLIDFQISWFLDPHCGGRSWPARKILKILQAADRYHLLKHWRRARPDQLSAEQIAQSGRPPFWIAWHRLLFRPLTSLRRQVLTRLGARSSAHGRSPG